MDLARSQSSTSMPPTTFANPPSAGRVQVISSSLTVLGMGGGEVNRLPTGAIELVNDSAYSLFSKP
jgi:hypothetical protein